MHDDLVGTSGAGTATVATPWLVEVTDQVAAGPQALELLGGACHPATTHHSARTLRFALDTALGEELEARPLDLRRRRLHGLPGRPRVLPSAP